MSASLTSPRWLILTCLVQFDLSVKVLEHRLHRKLLKSSFSTYLDASPKISQFNSFASTRDVLRSDSSFALGHMSFKVSFSNYYLTIRTALLIHSEMFFTDMSPAVLWLRKVSSTDSALVNFAKAL